MTVAIFDHVGAIIIALFYTSDLSGTALLVALFIPLRDPRNQRRSPLRELEHDLHGAVAYGVLPLFAFANSGMSLTGIDAENLPHPVTIGVAAGLSLGK